MCKKCDALDEASAKELVKGSIRKGRSFAPKGIKYTGYSFRSKNAYFKTGKYEQKVRIPDIKVISRLKGKDSEKVAMALDSDIKVHCTCADFKYRFQYQADVLDYGTDKESRPAKVTNPDNEGTVCKHLTYLLANLDKYADAIAFDIGFSRKNKYKSIKRESKMNVAVGDTVQVSGHTNKGKVKALGDDGTSAVVVIDGAQYDVNLSDLKKDHVEAMVDRVLEGEDITDVLNPESEEEEEETEE